MDEIQKQLIKDIIASTETTFSTEKLYNILEFLLINNSGSQEFETKDLDEILKILDNNSEDAQI